MLAFSGGFSLLIKRLSLTKSSKVELDEVKVQKSSMEAVWPVSERWESVLEGEGCESVFPV